MKRSLLSTPRLLSFRSRAGLMGIAAAILFSQPLQSAVYISNIESPNNGGQAVADWIWAGFSFTTDSADYTLDRVNALLWIYDGAALEGRLYRTHSSGAPESWISEVTFTQTPKSGGTYQVITFTPTTVMQLEANTTYTFALAGLTGTVTNWGLSKLSETSTEVPGSSWSLLPGLFMSMSNGMYWAPNDTDILASVEASAIPEPGSVVMMVGGGILAGAAALRRRKAAGGR